MIIGNVLYNNKKYIGSIKDNKFYPFNEMGIKANTINELIESYTLDELNNIVKYEIYFNLDECELLAPIEHPKADILCLGLNYAKHIAESMRYKSELKNTNTMPVYFSKRCNSSTNPYGEIDGHFDITERLDYECELALIISKDAYKVSIKDAYNYVFGYMVFNDVSARDLQMSHKEWHYGKSLDTFCPMGPYIVTSDSINPSNLAIKSYVNGELRQNGNTSDFIYDIPFIINDLTKGITLSAGTIISTGTPEGVGMGFNPPKFLKSGDVVRCEIEGIGYIENKVK